MAISHEPDLYQVVVKAFLVQGEKVLVCYDPRSQAWDLPGGRINVDEFSVPLESVLEREVREELGEKVRFSVARLVTVFRHRRVADDGSERRFLMLGYEVRYESGDIQLSDEHTEYRWVSLDEAAALLPGGQQQGIINYAALRNPAP